MAYLNPNIIVFGPSGRVFLQHEGTIPSLIPIENLLFPNELITTRPRPASESHHIHAHEHEDDLKA